MAGDLTTQISITADASGVEAGVGVAKRSLNDLGVTASRAGKQASDGLGTIGKGGKDAADKVEASTKSLIGSIQRTTAALEAGSKSGRQYFEALANQRGINTDSLAPYLAQLDQANTKAKEAGHGIEEMGFKTAGAKRELLVLAHELSQANYSRFAGSLLVLGERTGAAALLFNAATLSVVGLTLGLVGLGVAVVHADRLQQALNGLQAQLIGTGRAGLMSTEEIKKFITELARAPDVSRDAATSIVSELSKVHNIGGGLFRDLAASAVDYAKATGTDVPAAAKALAKAFDDPAQGAKSLDAALGTLTSTQILQIEKLSAQNDLIGAQRALFDALEQSVKGLADDAMTPLQKATNDLGIAWEKSMQSFGKQEGLKNANSAMTLLLGRMKSVVEYLPTFEAKWKGAFNGGLNGLVMSALGIGGEAPKQTGIATGSWGAQTGGATGNWGETPKNSAGDDAIKRALDLGKSYEGVNGKIAQLTQTRKTLNEALTQSVALYGKESDQAKKLRDEIEGVDDAIKAAQKKNAGPAYKDDAATKMLEGLRETQAQLAAQLAGEDKLTEAQKAQAKFQQLISDLKGKTLTADQKSLLANKDAINAQLAVNVGLDQALEKKARAAKLAEQELNFARQMEALSRSAASANQSRSDQYDRSLSAFGLGARENSDINAQKSIRKEYNGYLKTANNEAAKASKDGYDALNSQEYLSEVAKIKAALAQALADQQAYFDALKAKREDWKNGATTALADYLDEVDNAAKRAQTLVTTGLTDITDGITGLLTGTQKLSSFKDYGNKIAAQITKGIVEQDITKPIAEWLQGALKDPDSIIGKLLGALTGGKDAAGSIAGLLGGGSGAAATATMATSATAASTALAALTQAAAAATVAMGGSAASSALSGALSIANGVGASGGDALGSLISLMGWADGGYTGDGGKYQPAGVVHAGEYVINKESTSMLGVNFLDQLNRRGYADGGFVGAVMAGNLTRPAGGDGPGATTIVVHQNFTVQGDVNRNSQSQLAAAAARGLRQSQRSL